MPLAESFTVLLGGPRLFASVAVKQVVRANGTALATFHGWPARSITRTATRVLAACVNVSSDDIAVNPGLLNLATQNGRAIPDYLESAEDDVSARLSRKSSHVARAPQV